MRTILDLCVDMDSFAHRTYETMATSCPEPDLAEVFSGMAGEKANHTAWWQDLIAAWEKGLVPDVVNDTEGLERHMRSLYSEMQITAPDDFAGVPVDVMLDIAARMEFFLLDPIFGELLDLTEPGGARKHRESYARHLERIITAIEVYYTRKDFASFLARVLRRAWRDNLALAAFASRDPLTTMYNRRGLMAHLDQWLSWAGRYTRPLGVLLIDVDDFKAINDSHGHAVGDLALRATAQALTDTIRGSDMAGRYGGDEFVVVAPETDTKELISLAGRLIESVEKAELEDWDGTQIPLHVSVGGAIATNPGAENTTVDGLLATADRSLFGAKRSGKARTGEILAYTTTEDDRD